MSGPKCARIKPNPRMELERLAAEAARRVQGWQEIADPQSVASQLEMLAHLEESIRSQVQGRPDALTLLAAFADRRAALLKGLECRRPAYESFQQALAAFRQVIGEAQSPASHDPIAPASPSQIPVVLAQTGQAAAQWVDEALAYTRDLTAGAQALIAISARTRGGALPETGGDSILRTLENLTREATLTHLASALARVRAVPPDQWGGSWEGVRPWLRDQDGLARFQGACEQAQTAIDHGDVEGAPGELAQASRLAEALLAEATHHRDQAADLEKAALAWQRTLSDLHYDRPIANFRPGVTRPDPLAPLKLRADVPQASGGGHLGHGNIRIALAFDGKIDLEIENVPTGEEETCRAVIARLSEAAANAGLDFRMTDWGRAEPAPPTPAASLATGQERERERPKERE